MKTYPESEYPIEVRARAFHAIQDPTLSKFQFEVWPIPTELVEELYEPIKDLVNKLLTERGLVSGLVVEVPSEDPPFEGKILP